MTTIRGCKCCCCIPAAAAAATASVHTVFLSICIIICCVFGSTTASVCDGTTTTAASTCSGSVNAMAGFASLDGAGFFDKLATRVTAINSLLCVGLDPHVDQLQDKSAKGALAFCKRIIEATGPYAAAYKPNAAFFEAFGAEGAAALKEVIELIPPEIPVLLDAKRGDIGTTAAAYAVAAFDELGADSITLNAYMGFDTVQPFISDPARGVFILCKTSNPSSNELQTLTVNPSSSSRSSNTSGNDGSPRALYEEVAALAQSWNGKNNIGLVVGATDVEALTRARAAAPDLWILAPGIGAQGGDLEAACEAALDRRKGKAMMGLLIPISRGISKATDPGAAAISFRDAINAVRVKLANETEQQEACTAKGAAIPGEDSGSGDGETLAAYQKEFIDFALSQNVLKFGSFTLKSGRQSPYFFNAGLFSTGGALASLGRCYAEAISRASPALQYDVLFGPAYKGISLGAAVALTLAEKHGRADVGFAYNRKEKKDHGEGGTLVGCELKGKRALIIDDVITGGTAIREAIAMLQQAGAVPAGVVIALDRQEKTGAEGGGDKSAVQQVVDEYGIPVVSVIGLHQIKAYMEGGGAVAADSSILEAIKEYQARYGISG